MNRVGFVLAAGSWLTRKGMVAALHRIPGTWVVSETDNAKALQEFFRNHDAEFLVISQELFDRSTDLFLARPSLLDRTILLTDRPDSSDTQNAHAAIHSEAGKEEILSKINGILEARYGPATRPDSQELSPREQTILRFVTMGLTNKQIADRLFLSAHTVITHRKNIIGKLGIKSVSGLTIYAIVNNIITIEEVTSKPDR